VTREAEHINIDEKGLKMKTYKVLSPVIGLTLLLTNQIALAQSNIDTFVREAKYRLTKNFLDPEAAKFRNLQVREWQGKDKKYLSLCGEVNAKNAMGAYTGYKKFSAGKDSGDVIETDGSPADGIIIMAKWDIPCGSETKLIKKVK